MYYIISPLIWPFTIIPNLPQNLIEVIDSPIPLLIGMLGDEILAQKIDKIRGGNNNIFIIENGNLTYYKDEKLSFDDNPLFNMLHSLKKNFEELKLVKNKKIKNEFISTYCDLNKNSDFYRIFAQTQIFASYLDKYIENNR